MPLSSVQDPPSSVSVTGALTVGFATTGAAQERPGVARAMTTIILLVSKYGLRRENIQ
jgi:hypothetical protein